VSPSAVPDPPADRRGALPADQLRRQRDDRRRIARRGTSNTESISNPRRTSAPPTTASRFSPLPGPVKASDDEGTLTLVDEVVGGELVAE